MCFPVRAPWRESMSLKAKRAGIVKLRVSHIAVSADERSAKTSAAHHVPAER